MDLSNPIFRQVGIVALVTAAIVYTAAGTPMGTAPMYHLTERDEISCAARGLVVGNACIRRATEQEVLAEAHVYAKLH